MRFFSFRGRADRRTYLLVAVMSYLVDYPLLTITKTCAAMLGLTSEPWAFFWPALSRLVQHVVRSRDAALAVSIACWLAIALMSFVVLAVGARRLHDANLSGWYVLTPLLVTSILPKAAQGDVVSSAVEVVCDILLIALPATDTAWRLGPIISEPARQKPIEVF